MDQTLQLIAKARTISQNNIASRMRIPSTYLHSRWGSDCVPERDLFTTKRGFFEPIWALDVGMWETVGLGYAEWTLVPPNKAYWKLLHDLLLNTVDWWGAEFEFQNWIRRKAGI